MSTPRRWTLDKDALGRLLDALGPDREAASRRYEEIRRRLIHFFDWRESPSPETEADETLDRVARKLQEGTAVEDVGRYACVVARYVLQESARRQIRERNAAHEEGRLRVTQAPRDIEARLACLKKCLAELPAEQRSLIEGYYQGRGRVHLDERKALAERLGVTYASLKMRAFRTRGALEDCLRECLAAEKTGNR